MISLHSSKLGVQFSYDVLHPPDQYPVLPIMGLGIEKAGFFFGFFFGFFNFFFCGLHVVL